MELSLISALQPPELVRAAIVPILRPTNGNRMRTRFGFAKTVQRRLIQTIPFSRRYFDTLESKCTLRTCGAAISKSFRSVRPCRRTFRKSLPAVFQTTPSLTYKSSLYWRHLEELGYVNRSAQPPIDRLHTAGSPSCPEHSSASSPKDGGVRV